MKRKLFLLLCALLTSVGMWADVDFTSYLGDLNSYSNGGWAGECGNNHTSQNDGAWWNTQTLSGGHSFRNGESWCPNYGNAGVMMGRTIAALPAGRYTLSFEAYGATSANATTATVPAAGDVKAFFSGSATEYDVTNTTLDDATYHEVSYTFDVTSDFNTQYTFGIKKLTDDSKANWGRIRNVSLKLITSATDNTSLITNPDFTNSTLSEGWSGTGSNKANEFVKQTGNITFNGNFAEMYGSTLKAGDLNQTLTGLPAGVYQLFAKVQAGIACSLYASVGGSMQKRTCRSSARVESLTFIVTGTSDVTIGLKHAGKSSSGNAWIAVDGFKLLRVGDTGAADLTSQIDNWDFTNCAGGWGVSTNFPGWDVSNPNGGNAWAHSVSGVATAVEYYIGSPANGSFDYYQSVTVPNGKYTLSASMWNTQIAAPSGECGVYGTSSNGTAFAGVTEDRDDTNLGTYTTGGVVVTDNTLRVGVKNNTTMKARWFGVDWIKLNYLGTTLMNEAVDLPDGGAMAAGTWYKFTPGSAGGYNLTVTTPDDVVYTTDGTILTADASSVTEKFGSNPVTLSATTYYIKSSSANKFEYEIDSYDLTEEIEAYNTAVTKANTAKDNADAADKVNAGEYTALTTAISTYGSVDTSGPQNKAMKDALDAATPALNDAADAVNTSVIAYANAKTYLEQVEAVLATTNFYSQTAYNNVYGTYKTAYDAGTLEDATASGLNYKIASSAGTERYTNNTANELLMPGWKIGETAAETTNSGFYQNTWSGEGNEDGTGFTTPFFEYWVSGANNLGANTFVATVEGLANSSLYAVDIWARIQQREGNVKVDNSITMKVGEGAAVDLTQGIHTGMTRRFLNEYTAYGYTDEAGKLTVTITVAANSNISWLSFKNVNYTRVEGANALDQVISEVTDLNGHVPTNVYGVADAIVTNHSGGNYPTTDSEFATAISDIRAAAATAATYKEAYEEYLSLKGYADALVAVTNDNASANSTLATAISTAATNANSVENVAALTTVNTTLKTAMVTYVGAANPVGDGKTFNLTFMLNDPDLTGFISWEGKVVNGITGWNTEQVDGNSQVMDNESVACSEGDAFFEYWSSEAKTNEKFALYLTTTLPEGTYSMSCYAFASPNGVAEADDSKVYFYANDTQGDLVSESVLTQKGISFVNTSEQEVKIGLKTCAGNEYRWMGIGYVELYKVPEQEKDLDEDHAWDNSYEGAGVVNVTRTFKEGVNTVVFPFSMTQSEVEAYFGTGSVVYQLRSYEPETGTIHFTTKSGITANEPCLVKATSTDNSGAEYRLEGRTIVATGSASPSYAGENVTMTGTYAAETSIAQGNYIVSGSNIYLVNSDNVKMKNTRAYITLGTPNLGARLAIIFDEEDPTAINTIEAAESEAGALKDGKYLIEDKIVIVKNGVKYDANGKKLN